MRIAHDRSTNDTFINNLSQDQLTQIKDSLNLKMKLGPQPINCDQLQQIAENLAGQNKNKLFTQDVSSELSLATLARVVVALISGRSMGPSEALGQIHVDHLEGASLESLVNNRKTLL